jgi:hypothetical protein
MVAHNGHGSVWSEGLAGRIREIRWGGLLMACLLLRVDGCLGFSGPVGDSQAIHIENLSVVVRAGDGTYEIQTGDGGRSVMHAGVAAEIDHKWVKSTEYPKHEITQSSFEDVLGQGKEITVTSSGLADVPDLAYTVQIYEGRAFGVIEVAVQKPHRQWGGHPTDTKRRSLRKHNHRSRRCAEIGPSALRQFQRGLASVADL